MEIVLFFIGVGFGMLLMYMLTRPKANKGAGTGGGSAPSISELLRPGNREEEQAQ